MTHVSVAGRTVWITVEGDAFTVVGPDGHETSGRLVYGAPVDRQGRPLSLHPVVLAAVRASAAGPAFLDADRHHREPHHAGGGA